MAYHATSERTARAMSPALAWGLTLLMLFVAGILLFWNLGAYPFWGDEADTVIFARSVWETGDTSAWYGENLYVYRDGTLLEHFKNRSVPPAAYYLVAPFWGLFGADHFALRFVFALCTLATVAIIGRWLYRSQASEPVALCLGVALVLNVSFILYGRQCRYFALATFLTTLIAYLYNYYDGSRRYLAATIIGLCLLAATHYLHFAAAVAALVVDYALFGRKRRQLTTRDWLALLVPTTLVVAALVYVYNPLGKHGTDSAGAKVSLVVGKAKLFWWSLRDLNTCEYGVGIIMALAPLVAWWRRSPEIARLFLACLAYTAVTVALSPQPVGDTLEADVRYLAPMIPGYIALTVLVIDRTLGGRIWLTAPLVALVVFTNVLHKPWDRIAWRSTIGEFVHELRAPRMVAGRRVADWLQAHVAPGATVWIMPPEWVAEQIVEAPHVVYGWQLFTPRRPADYAELPRIYFAGEVPIDYMVAFGFGNLPKTMIDHVNDTVLPQMAERGFHYKQVATLDVYFDDRTRPELFWHWFRDQPYDTNKRSVAIFALQRP